MMSKNGVTKMTNEVLNADTRTETEYQISMHDGGGNVMTILTQVQLIDTDRLEEFRMPFRETSQRYLERLTRTGLQLTVNLSRIGGVTSIQVLLYEVRVMFGGLFDQQYCLERAKEIVIDALAVEGLRPSGCAILRKMKHDQESRYGPLPQRLQMMRQLHRKKIRQ